MGKRMGRTQLLLTLSVKDRDTIKEYVNEVGLLTSQFVVSTVIKAIEDERKVLAEKELFSREY